MGENMGDLTFSLRVKGITEEQIKDYKTILEKLMTEYPEISLKELLYVSRTGQDVPEQQTMLFEDIARTLKKIEQQGGQ